LALRRGSLGLDIQAEGSQVIYSQTYNNTEALNYTSGIIHHVELQGLAPGTRYFYSCGDPGSAAHWSPELNFTTLPRVGADAFPLRLGVIGDLGQTANSSCEWIDRTRPRRLRAVSLATSVRRPTRHVNG
jgi:Purple acid Phosphatase, N-terminal domain